MMMKKPFTLLTLLCVLLLLISVGCGKAPAAGGTITGDPIKDTQEAAEASSAPAAEPTATPIDASDDTTDEPKDNVSGALSATPIVEITMQDGGVIRLQLDREQAPITVENFLTLAEKGFYDGLTFHRIVPGFVIQGGDPEGTGRGGPGHNIKGEFTSNGWSNTISHQPGVISMARSGQPDSAGSQFFIVVGDATFLDGDYAGFGIVIEGMDVVEGIVGVPRNKETPVEPVVMETVRVISK